MTKTQKLTVTSLFVAVGILLPLLFHVIGGGVVGTMLLPMHLPVLCCGFLCGPLYGLACGLLVPVCNCLLTGMPAAYPMLPILTCELCVYGVLSGVFHQKTLFRRIKGGIYAALVLAMLCGRAAYGLAWSGLFLLNPQMKAPTVFAAVTAGVPGIVLQLLLVPSLVLAIKHGFRKDKKALAQAVSQIKNDRAACVVLKNGTLQKTAEGRGIAPILSLYDEGLLAGATVVDKIVGKAAAMIMTAGGVSACYALTVSKTALSWFRSHGVFVEYETCVDVIINRQGNGPCPMEQTVKTMDSESEAIFALRQKIQELREKRKGESL